MTDHPMDRDGDGRPGGSRPFADRDVEDLVPEAERLGLKIDRRATRRTLQAAIAAQRSARRATGVARARAVADQIRSAWPDKAAEIDLAIAETEAGRRDGLTITGSVRYRLEKFEGDITPDSTPVEIIEGEDNL